MKSFGTFLVFVCVWCKGSSIKIPVSFQTCRTNSNFDDCLAKAIEDALPKLKSGFPDVDIPPLEPLYVPSMKIGEGKGAVHVEQHYKNIKLLGATKSDVTKVDGAKIRDFRLYAETFTPSLKLEANYKLNGRILLIPIRGEGNCTIILENLNATHTTIGEKLEKKGKIYMFVKKYVITLHPGKVKFHFGNLFNGDERLGKAMNNLLNQHWSDVFEDVKPGYEESFGLIFGNFANKIYSKVPFKELFLD